MIYLELLIKTPKFDNKTIETKDFLSYIYKNDKNWYSKVIIDKQFFDEILLLSDFLLECQNNVILEDKKTF